jgi:hypothetical protein
MPRTSPAPTLRDAQTLCQKARLAGSPGSAARTPLVNEYRRMTAALGVEAEETPTGRDLVKATSALLRMMSGALREVAATSSLPTLARPKLPPPPPRADR